MKAQLIQVVTHHDRPDDEYVLATSEAASEALQVSELLSEWEMLITVPSGLPSRIVIRYGTGKEVHVQ